MHNNSRAKLDMHGRPDDWNLPTPKPAWKSSQSGKPSSTLFSDLKLALLNWIKAQISTPLVMSKGSPDWQWLIAKDFLPLSSTAEEQIGTTIDSSWFGKSILSVSLNLLPIRTFVADFAAATTQTGSVNSFKLLEELTIKEIPWIIF